MGGNTSHALPANMDTIPKLVQMWSQVLPDRELFVFYNGKNRQSFTSLQVFQLAGKFAGMLRRKYGFQKGDIIANTLPNSPERMLTDLGITLAGCICMSAELLYTDGSDFLYTARNAGLSAVIVCPDSQFPAWRILESYISWDQVSPTAPVTCKTVHDMKQAILVSRRSFLKELQDSTEDIFMELDIRSDDIMYLYTTSGSTGFCKLVPKSHATIIDSWSNMMDRVREKSKQVWESTVQYNDRSLGWTVGFPHGQYVSADTRVLLDTFDSQGIKGDVDVWDIISRERVDYVIMMPLDLSNILRRPNIDGVTNYKAKLICCGGQPIMKNQRLSYKALAQDVFVVYGSTEVGFMSYDVIGDKDVDDYFCGQLKPGEEIRIVQEDGTECKTGQIGTIQVRGKSVFKGYLNKVENPDPKTLAAFTQDGFFKMEDDGYFDEDRNLYVLGRSKEVISFGALIVYPGWLESRLKQHPDVAEVCVVPVSDPVLYQNICAVVQPVPGHSLTEEKLRAFCDATILHDEDGTPVPKFYLILEDFPKGTTGKMDKKHLRKMANDNFGS